MTDRWPVSEVELAEPVVAWLRAQQWDVYQEVSAYSRTADIVATRGPLIWVIEAKRSLSLEVMDQAYHWRTWAHLSSVAVPRRRRGGYAYAKHCLMRDGLGMLVVKAPNPYEHDVERVREELPAHLHRRIVVGLRTKLNEAQKTFAPAGSQNGGWTPFLGTCQALQRYVDDHPGATLGEAIGSIKTHYQTPASARGSLAKWIQAGVVKGVRSEYDGKALRLYPVQS